MRILFTGDSITDMGRNRSEDFAPNSYGYSYPFFIQGALGLEAPGKNELLNRGISGNRSVDLYARVKCDCINLEPDLISVLIGVNDVWHEKNKNGVSLERYEQMFRMFIEDNLKANPHVKMMIMEPFVLHGVETDPFWDLFKTVYDYAKVAQKLALEYGLYFVPLQKRLNELAEQMGPEKLLYDGVHPAVVGARVMADEWLKVYKTIK